MNTMKRPAAALAFVLVTASSGAEAADKELLDTLLANGAITQEQYARLLREEEPPNEDGRDMAVSFDGGGLEISSPNGDFSIDVGARLHADWAKHSGDGPEVEAVDGTNLRRARIELGGRLHRDWQWAAETDFANNDVSIKDFWLSYRALSGVNLTVGHQKQPYSLTLEMSSNDIPFIERPAGNALVAAFTDRAIGVRADSSGERWFAAAGVFGESIDPVLDGDEGWGTNGRFVYAPVIDDERVVHVGLRAAYREPSTGDGSIRLRSETTNFSDLHIVDTGPITAVDSVSLFGPEAAVVLGPFSLTGEYNDATIARSSGGDLDFDSWHVAATWTLGGESRAAAYEIDAGEFKRLTAAQNFNLGDGGGTWELAARYACLDLNDGALTGGREETLTVGANWYANPNVRMMLDWTRVIDTDRSTPRRVAADGLDVFALRAQYAF